jgi:hypothetical protein
MLTPARPPIAIDALPIAIPDLDLSNPEEVARKLGVEVPKLTPEEERLLRERFGINK